MELDSRATIGEHMKRALVFVVAALALPTSVAFAQPSHPATGGKSAPKVMYVLKGSLSTYTAYDSATSTNGSITILVKHSNYHAKALVGSSMTFTLTSQARVTNGHGKPVTQITDGTKGVLKFKAPLRMPKGTDLVSALPTAANVKHVIAQQHA
jgi:hypothetical protein